MKAAREKLPTTRSSQSICAVASGKKGKWSDEEESGWQVDIQSDRLPALD